MSIIIILHN